MGSRAHARKIGTLAGRGMQCKSATMDGSPKPHEMDSEEVLRVKLQVLKAEHADLDAAVRAIHEAGRGDALTLQRLKRKKLMLKDRIADIEDSLLPDIIA